MQGLIEIVEDEARVSHRVVAQNTENQQKNIAELIHKYRDDFEEFGRCPFKTETLETKGGVQEAKTYYLNEPQATFLMTLLRNKPIVVEFKKKLVKAFYKQREVIQESALQTPNLNAVMIEMMKTQQEQSKMMIDVVKDIANFMKESRSEQKQVEHNTPVYLDSRDRKKLRDAIAEKAKETAKDLGVSVSTMSPAIWIELKNFFDVDDYQDLEKSQLKDVMHFVMFWEPKKRARDLAPQGFVMHNAGGAL